MFRNNLIIALRTILRNKTNSIVNIAGLAIGLACVILIASMCRTNANMTVSLKKQTGFTRSIWMR